jgi:hypothetical protein
MLLCTAPVAGAESRVAPIPFALEDSMPKAFPPPALALILALATGAAPLAASAGPGFPAPAASAPLAGIVVDAQGAPMGPYYPGATVLSGAVLLSLAGRPVLLPLRGGDAHADPDNMEPAPNGGEVFFETTDCSGQGWLQTSRRVGVADVTVQPTGPHDVLVYMPDTAPPSNVTVESALVVRTARQAPVCQVGQALGRMRKVLQVIDISTLYVAPYHLQ